MLNKLFFSIFLFFTHFAFSLPLLLNEIETKEQLIELKYLKVGNELAAGYRLHKKSHGLDLSIGHSSLFGESWTGGKVIYLFYPLSHLQSHFYMGAGAGFGHGSLNVKQYMPPLLNGGKSSNEIHKDKIYSTIEGVIGYEFPYQKRKIFIQIELSAPLGSEPLPLFIYGPGESWKPGIAAGVGF